MGINGDVQHKLMSLHISSIETQQTSTYICIFLFCFVLFFLFVVYVGLREKKKKIQEMQKELRI